MRVDGSPRRAPATECPYLPGRTFVQRYFHGIEASPTETAELQSAGWRRFGMFFFRPECPGCQACTSVRVDAQRLQLTASQRRVWNRNQDVEVRVVPVEYRPEYFLLYQEHSQSRFQKESDEESFIQTFFVSAVPAFLTEYWIDGVLAGLGFCDESSEGLSSVYFVFQSNFASRSLGIFSVLWETRYAAQKGKRWYYLGYWVPGNATMAYKARFFPRQMLNWNTGTWSE